MIIETLEPKVVEEERSVKERNDDLMTFSISSGCNR